MNIRRTNLVLGCGWWVSKDYKGDLFTHNNIHPKHLWVTVDCARNQRPDVIADVMEPGLKQKIMHASLYPRQGFNIIYAEYLTGNVYSAEHFYKNIENMLHENGLFITTNMGPNETDFFENLRSGMFLRFYNFTILTKKPMPISSIVASIRAAHMGELDKLFDWLNCLEQQTMRFEDSPTSSVFHQLIVLNDYIERYLQESKPYFYKTLWMSFFSNIQSTQHEQFRRSVESLHQLIKQTIETKDLSPLHEMQRLFAEIHAREFNREPEYDEDEYRKDGGLCITTEMMLKRIIDMDNQPISHKRKRAVNE